MFGRKKPERPKRNHSGKNLNQYGLFDIPTDLSFNENDSGSFDNEADSDLEAELRTLTSDVGTTKPRAVQKPNMLPVANLDAMLAESLKDVPTDEEISDSEDDPDLLNELNEITGENTIHETEAITSPCNEISTLLSERLKLYETAEANAKSHGESSRARRFGRGITTLKELIKQANDGKPINMDDVPPEVSINIKKPESPAASVPSSPASVPSRPAPVPPNENTNTDLSPTNNIDTQETLKEPTTQTDANKQLLQLLNTRRTEYKMAALTAKKAGDSETALLYVKVAKQFEAVINAVEQGQVVDLSGMPGSPPPPHQSKLEENVLQKHDNPESGSNSEEQVGEENLITASSVTEALQQRLEVYKKQEVTAKEQGNSSKARRMGRIVKQFDEAIKLYNAGKPVPFDDLPTPPGYAPIPIPGNATPNCDDSKPDQVKPTSVLVTEVRDTKPTPPPRSTVSRISGNHAPTTRAEKQVQLLLTRQKEFKLAALNAKKKGEMEQAKEFLKTARGFDPLIEASQGGLPVDISSLPIPPSTRSQLENEYELVMAEECTEDDTGNIDVLSRLETQLTKQLKMCLTTRDHNKAIGDVAGTNRFEQLALSVTKDLDVVRLAKRTQGTPVPKFHYGMKNFSIVKTFTELNDNDLELCINRGINYNCSNPKDVDTYVRFEFPYPQEEPIRDRTSTVKDTNNPEYNASFMLTIDRNIKSCQRMFKRHAIKLEVYSKGCFASNFSCCFSGFFRGDTLLGSVSVKLQPLETQCEIHDSFDLMDGRKKVGGKLEVRIRVRNPIINKQIEQISEKWLSLDT